MATKSGRAIFYIYNEGQYNYHKFYTKSKRGYGGMFTDNVLTSSNTRLLWVYHNLSLGIPDARGLYRLPPMWVLASSRSNSSLGSSMMGLGGLAALEAAVKLDVAP